MRVHFLKPTPNRDGSVPENIVARVAVSRLNALIPDAAIGGITIWAGDGSRKDRPKGVLSVSMPQYGGFAGRPVRTPGAVNEDGDQMPDTYSPSKAGAEQVGRFGDAILQAFTDLRRAKRDPFVGSHDLVIVGAETTEPAKEALTDAELEALTNPSAETAKA